MYSSNKLGIVEIVTHPWAKYSNSPFRFIRDRLPFLVKEEKNWMFYDDFFLTQQGHCFCVREYHGGGILFKLCLPRLIGRARKVDHVDIQKYSDHFLSVAASVVMIKCVKIDIRPKHWKKKVESLILFKFTLNVSLRWHLKNVNAMCNFGIFWFEWRDENINHFFREGAKGEGGDLNGMLVCVAHGWIPRQIR